MTKQIRAIFACAALAMGLLSSSGTPAGAESTAILAVQTFHSIILNTPNLTRIAIGDGRIAGVVPIGTSQLLINGKMIGHTTLMVWQGSRRTDYEVTVTESGADDIAQILRAAINEPGVEVVEVDYNFIIRGTVPDVEAYRHLNDVIGNFRGMKFHGTSDHDITVVNAVQVAKPLGNLQDEIATVPGTHGIRVDSDGQGNVVVSGTVHDRTEGEQVLDKVRGLAGPFLSTNGKVIDRLASETTSQVDVKVYILEVDKTATSQLGLRLADRHDRRQFRRARSRSKASSTGFRRPISWSRSRTRPTLRPSAAGSTSATWRAPRTSRRRSICCSQTGHARLLSSPNLVTLPGTSGDVPRRRRDPDPRLQRPRHGHDHLQTVRRTVERDAHAARQRRRRDGHRAGSLGPRLRQRHQPQRLHRPRPAHQSADDRRHHAERREHRDGRLLRRIETRTIQKIPVLGDLPILGVLFRSTGYQSKTPTSSS